MQWIADDTTHGRAITSAIPPAFEAYATLELPGTPGAGRSWSADLDEQHEQDAGVVSILRAHTPEAQPWWLGYLETGIGAETIFYDVPTVKLYAAWSYVLIEGGPEQAERWRDRNLRRPAGPDLSGRAPMAHFHPMGRPLEMHRRLTTAHQSLPGASRTAPSRPSDRTERRGRNATRARQSLTRAPR